MQTLLSEKNTIIIAKLLLRYGLAIVFLWFGFTQLNNPSQWTSFLPSFVSNLPISQEHFVMINGLFEVFCAALLLVGAYTRLSALLLGLHLIGITFTIGLSSVGVRDFGLSVATLALALLGSGTFSIDTIDDKNSEVLLGNNNI